jgi:hypothetical protein
VRAIASAVSPNFSRAAARDRYGQQNRIEVTCGVRPAASAAAR